MRLLAPYLDCVGAFGPDGRPALYPGSPMIAARLMRPQDRAIFCELRPDAFEALRYRFGRDARVKTIHIDGYTGLGAYAPPKERRGLVLIDPPFERTDEFAAMFDAFLGAYRKMADRRLRAMASVEGRAGGEGVSRKFRKGRRQARAAALTRGGERRRRLAADGPDRREPALRFRGRGAQDLAFLAPRLAQGAGAGFEIEQVTGE